MVADATTPKPTPPGYAGKKKMDSALATPKPRLPLVNRVNTGAAKSEREAVRIIADETWEPVDTIYTRINRGKKVRTGVCTPKPRPPAYHWSMVAGLPRNTADPAV